MAEDRVYYKIITDNGCIKTIYSKEEFLKFMADAEFKSMFIIDMSQQ